MTKNNAAIFESFRSISDRDSTVDTDVLRFTTVYFSHSGLIQDVQSRMKDIIIKDDEKVFIRVEHRVDAEHHHYLNLISGLDGFFLPRMLGWIEAERYEIRRIVTFDFIMERSHQS